VTVVSHTDVSVLLRLTPPSPRGSYAGASIVGNSSRVPTSPSDGTVVATADIDDTDIYATGLTPDTDWYFAPFAINAAGVPTTAGYPSVGPVHTDRTAAGGWQDSPILLPPTGKALFGVYPSPREDVAGRVSAGWSAINRQFGRTIRMTTQYTFGGRQSTGPDPIGIKNTAQGHLNAGRIPRVELQATNYAIACNFSVVNLWRRIADGDFDGDANGNLTAPGGRTVKGIRPVLQALGNLTRGAMTTNRIYFSVCHEADLLSEQGGDNGTWAGTYADFRAMWQHIWDLAHDPNVGATNLVWYFDMAFNPYGRDWGINCTDTGSSGMYPGHKYTDWVGWDPYNHSGQRGHGANYMSFTQIQRGPADKMAWWDSNFAVGGSRTGTGPIYKPIMLGECGTMDWNPDRTPFPGVTGANKQTRGTYMGDGEDWMVDMAKACAPGGALAEKMKGISYMSIDYSSTGVCYSLNPDFNPQTWRGLADIGQMAVFNLE
jgi:hypothetical protein